MTNINGIPQELRDVPQWFVCVEKRPYRPNRRTASKTNRDHFSSFDEVVACDWGDSISFAVTQGDPYTFHDLDACRDPETGQVDAWARDYVTKLGTYTEVTPSGTGLRCVSRGSSPFSNGRNIKLSLPEKGGRIPGIELYDRGHHMTITGQRLVGLTEIRDVDPEDIAELVSCLPLERQATAPEVLGTTDAEILDRARKYVSTMEPAISGQGGHNATFRVACKLVHGFDLSPEDALPILREYSERCDPPWSEKDLIHKVESAAKVAGERGYLRNAREEDWPSLICPEYEHGSNKADPDPAANRVIKIRPLRDVVIEYIGDLANDPTLRPYSTGLVDLDQRLGGGLCLGNINTIGARTGEGKTLIGMQLAHEMTRQGLPTLIISEEMAPGKLAKRTVQFVSDSPTSQWIGDEQRLVEQANCHFDARAATYCVHHLRHISLVCKVVRQAVEQHGVQVVVIDYVQRLESLGKNQTEVCSHVMAELGDLTRETGIMTIALCQVNRDAVKSHRKQKVVINDQDDLFRLIPSKEDLKQSGRIEEESDVVVMGMWVKGSLPSYQFDNDYLLRVEKVRDLARDREPVVCAIDAARMRILPSDVEPRHLPPMRRDYGVTRNPFEDYDNDN